MIFHQSFGSIVFATIFLLVIFCLDVALNNNCSEIFMKLMPRFNVFHSFSENDKPANRNKIYDETQHVPPQHDHSPPHIQGPLHNTRISAKFASRHGPFSVAATVQWITSTYFLKGILEETFQVFAREIQPVTNEQIRKYIQDELKMMEDLDSILEVIFNYLKQQGNLEFLSRPQQLFMLTELLKVNPSIQDELRDKTFTVVNLYHHYIDAKFQVYFKKANLKTSNFSHARVSRQFQKYRMIDYETAALVAILDRNTISQIHVDSKFFKDLKLKADGIGIITHIQEDGIPIFAHASYADFFVAKSLVKNHRRLNLVTFIFMEKHTNLRFMFDLMLAENCKVITEILHNNFENVTVEERDKVGRSPLQILASRGRRHHPLPTASEKKQLIIDDEVARVVEKETNAYDEAMDKLLNLYNPMDVDDLMNLNAFGYAEKTDSLSAIEAMARHQPANSLSDLQNYPTVLYYAIKFNYYMLFHRAFSQDLATIIVKESRNSLLHLAAIFNRLHFLQVLLSSGQYPCSLTNKENLRSIHLASINGSLDCLKHLASLQNVNLIDGDVETPLFYAAAHGQWTIVEHLLTINDIEVDAAKNYTPLYAASYNGHLRIVEELHRRGADINTHEKDGATPLYEAAFNGHLPIVRFLVKNEANVLKTYRNGRSSLYAATNGGHLDVVDFLIDFFDVTKTYRDGRTVLFPAASKGALEIVKLLLKKGADPTAASSSGLTPLYLAVLNNHQEIVEELLRHKVDVNKRALTGISPIYLAAVNNYLEIAEVLLKHKGVNVDLEDDEGRTPLYVAAREGHEDMVKLLLAKGASVNKATHNEQPPVYAAAREGRLSIMKLLIETYHANDNVATKKDGYTLLHTASSFNQIEIVKELISRLDVNSRDKSQATPLHLAASRGHLKIVWCLVNAGADVNCQDKSGRTPLYQAAHEGHTTIVRILLNKGADPNLTYKDGRSPLYVAARAGFLEIVQHLVQNKAVVNAASRQGFTALHNAAARGHVDIVRFLCASGADLDGVTTDGCTALFEGVFARQLEVVRVLLECGARVDVVNGEQRTPLYVAASNGDLDCIKLLREFGAVVQNYAEVMSRP